MRRSTPARVRSAVRRMPGSRCLALAGTGPAGDEALLLVWARCTANWGMLVVWKPGGCFDVKREPRGGLRLKRKALALSVWKRATIAVVIEVC